MMYVDPDGEWIWLAVAAVAGAYMGGVQQSGSWNPVKWDWSSGQLWAGIGVGAVAGLAGYGVGQAVMGSFAVAGTAGATVVQGGAISGMAAGAAGGAASGLINGGGQAWVGGASFWEGLKAGGEQALLGAATGGAVGGAVSGVSSVIKGNNFWTGVAKPAPTPALAPAQPTTQTVQQNTPNASNADMPENSNLPQKYYPDNDGALGDWQRKTLEPGTIIERRGPETGTYASPAGTPDAMKSLPPAQMNQPLHTYEVLQPLPVQQSTVAPWFGEPGWGTQYRLPMPVQDLKPIYLKPVK